MQLIRTLKLTSNELDLILESVKGYKSYLESGYGFNGIQEKIKKLDELISEIEHPQYYDNDEED